MLRVEREHASHVQPHLLVAMPRSHASHVCRYGILHLPARAALPVQRHRHHVERESVSIAKFAGAYAW